MIALFRPQAQTRVEDHLEGVRFDDIKHVYLADQAVASRAHGLIAGLLKITGSQLPDLGSYEKLLACRLLPKLREYLPQRRDRVPAACTNGKTAAVGSTRRPPSRRGAGTALPGCRHEPA